VPNPKKSFKNDAQKSRGSPRPSRLPSLEVGKEDRGQQKVKIPHRKQGKGGTGRTQVRVPCNVRGPKVAKYRKLVQLWRGDKRTEKPVCKGVGGPIKKAKKRSRGDGKSLILK